MDISEYRQVTKMVQGIPTSDGAGVKLTRVMGTHDLSHLDPFLLLDMFHSDNPGDYIAGFPNHPHRGFETVTYLLAGRVRHKDNAGHEGVIEQGGVQWMTAGRGIIHSEMPEQKDGILWGFQLWINLPAAKKMCAPKYQEFGNDEIPVETRDGGVILHIISGETSNNTSGPVQNNATITFYDVVMPPDTEFIEPIPAAFNSFIYIYVGGILLNSADGSVTHIEHGTLAVLGRGDGINIKADYTGSKFILLAAQPINEPMVRSGPFVMNTREEIKQAMEDYNQGRF